MRKLFVTRAKARHFELRAISIDAHLAHTRVRSDHPRSVAHDGTPGQILALLPDLHTLGREHQVDVIVCFGSRIPASLSAVRVGEVRRGFRLRDGLDEIGVDRDHVTGIAERESDTSVRGGVGHRARRRLSGEDDLAAVPRVRHGHEVDDTRW